MSKPCIVACGSLKPEIEKLLAQGDLDADVIFLDSHLHESPEHLEITLQQVLPKCMAECSRGVVVVYGDYCLGFQKSMKDFVAAHGAVKVDALNCIDCLLSGHGATLKLDPEHKKFFLTPGFLDFSLGLLAEPRERVREMFSSLDGIILVESLEPFDPQKVQALSEQTGLPVQETLHVGVDGVKAVLEEAIARL